MVNVWLLDRMLIVAKKRLPDAKKKERFYGFVESVDVKMEALTAALGPNEYETKTRGKRRVEAARLVGEGKPLPISLDPLPLFFT